MSGQVSAEEAAELTAACKHVEYDWQESDDRKWAAWLWCSSIGEPVIGFGPTALAAVLEAHRIAEAEHLA